MPRNMFRKSSTRVGLLSEPYSYIEVEDEKYLFSEYAGLESCLVMARGANVVAPHFLFLGVPRSSRQCFAYM